VYYLISKQGQDLTQRTPRIDYLKAVLLLCQEQMLTSKLGDTALANLLETLAEHMQREHDSLRRKIGG